MSTRSPATSIARYDPILGPVAATYRTAPPRALVAAVTARAVTESIPASLTRVWLVSRCPGPAAEIAHNRSAYGRIWSSADRHRRQSSSPQGRARLRLRAARSVVVGLLAPLPDGVHASPARTARARAVMAVLGAEHLRRATSHGYDTIVMSSSALGLDLGLTPATTRSLVTLLVDAGWVRRMPTRAHSPQRYKLPARLAADEGAIAWAHADVVDALGAPAHGVGGEMHPVEMMTLVTHPAWSYGDAPLGHMAWWVAVATEAGLDAEAAGVPVRTWRAAQRAWLGVLAETDGLDLRHALDERAARNGAVDARAEAGRARAEQVAAENMSRRLARERAAQGRERLQVLLRAHPLPAPTTPETDRTAWLTAAASAVAQGGFAEVERGYLARALASRMRARHYPARVATRVSRVICGLPAPTIEESAA